MLAFEAINILAGKILGKYVYTMNTVFVVVVVGWCFFCSRRIVLQPFAGKIDELVACTFIMLSTIIRLKATTVDE